MELQTVDGILFSQMINRGTSNLKIHAEEINNLNVFPIPDGDTGDNMLMTMAGGDKTLDKATTNLSETSEKIANGMLLGARGNSGVILSQFFAGIAKGFKGLEKADTQQIGNAFKQGVKQAYDAVMTPTEGTILTVAKDATNYACSINASTPLEFIEAFIEEAKLSLARTPDLLEVLKKAGVVDSGGAGLFYIARGMRQALLGDTKDIYHQHQIDNSTGNQTNQTGKAPLDLDKFTEDSVLEFGYCTELMLRLQNAKTNPQEFDVGIVKKFLEGIGNSVVCFKTGTIIKLHVHTMTPDKVLAFCQQFGEFLTVKIENMSLQHNNLGQEAAGADKTTAGSSAGTSADAEDSEETLETRIKPMESEHKKFALVAVAAGDGIKQTFKDYGVDQVVDGGQSMNPSAEDFIKAFEKIDADTIFVLPNNGNIILSAKQAAKMYEKADIRVIESKTIGEGFAAITMYNAEADNTEEIIEQLNSAMEGVLTYSISHCVRDAQMDGLTLHRGNYIGFSDKKIIATEKDRKLATISTIDKMDFTDHEVCIFIRGKDSLTTETEEIVSYLKKKVPNLELYEIDGGQDIYSYILILE